MIRQFIIRLVSSSILLVCATSVYAQSATPVVTDSRIKTFVYNENDVFSVLTHYGYQSNIEFGRSENVQTVSVGDRIAWQVVPAGRRLFIKALEENAHTNMTVVTNKRAYQFDLRSSGRVPLHPSEELVYVVRFFYPTDQQYQPNPAVFSDQPSVSAPPMAMPAQPGAPIEPVMASPQPQPVQMGYNFNYTLTGPDAIAPIRIYDDGTATYFSFVRGFAEPVQFFAMSQTGEMAPLPVSRNANGELVVQAILPRFAIQSGNQRVIVYNEMIPTT